MSRYRSSRYKKDIDWQLSCETWLTRVAAKATGATSIDYTVSAVSKQLRDREK